MARPTRRADDNHRTEGPSWRAPPTFARPTGSSVRPGPPWPATGGRTTDRCRAPRSRPDPETAGWFRTRQGRRRPRRDPRGEDLRIEAERCRARRHRQPRRSGLPVTPAMTTCPCLATSSRPRRRWPSLGFPGVRFSRRDREDWFRASAGRHCHASLPDRARSSTTRCDPRKRTASRFAASSRTPTTDHARPNKRSRRETRRAGLGGRRRPCRDASPSPRKCDADDERRR